VAAATAATVPPANDCFQVYWAWAMPPSARPRGL